MLKKLSALAAIAGFAGSAPAATYVVMPSPGSMAPPMIIVDENGHSDKVFVCASMTEIAAGSCRLHRKTARR